MSRSMRFILIGFLFLLLMLVRGFSSKLFYDPFITYFQNDYLLSGFPKYEFWKLFFNILLRYLLNGLISLGVIYLIFQNSKIVKFAIKFYSVLFIGLIIVYFILLQTQFSSGYLLGFYVRRMLIHPIALIVLLPAFYYQKKLSKIN